MIRYVARCWVITTSGGDTDRQECWSERGRGSNDCELACVCLRNTVPRWVSNSQHCADCPVMFSLSYLQLPPWTSSWGPLLCLRTLRSGCCPAARTAGTPMYVVSLVMEGCSP